MTILFALVAFQAAPTTKTCPDGATILLHQQCIAYPDHRRLLKSTPPETEKIVRWKCGKVWAEVKVLDTHNHQDATKQKVEARVGGRPIEGKLLAHLTNEFHVDGPPPILDGRCISDRPGHIRPVLVLLRGGERQRTSTEYRLN